MLVHIAASVAFCSLSIAQDPALPWNEASSQAQPGICAGFWWEDYDRDGLEDAFVVGADGSARLLRNSGDGSFADVTPLSGLDSLGPASFAAWQDFDRDGAPDVFVGTQSGHGHLMRNAGDGTFQDVTQFVGIDHSGRHLAAQWLDYDIDGLIDLSVRTDMGEHLYHALPGGQFERVNLGGMQAPTLFNSPTNTPEINTEFRAEESTSIVPERDLGRSSGRRPVSRPSPWGMGGTSLPSAATRLTNPPLAPAPGSWLVSACPPRITDSATGSCLQASSAPTLGMLYPLTVNLNVSGAGNVGIGTTTPAAKLEVAGSARITDTLTLAPAGDQALDLAAGSLYKGGALFIHTKGGVENTAVGREALKSVTSGTGNSASGFHALFSNTTGYSNTAQGNSALSTNTSGYLNTATGYRALAANNSDGNSAHGANALRANTSGGSNTAAGTSALFANTTGSNNTASGSGALFANTTASFDTADGAGALYSNTTGAYNTASGADALHFNTTGTRNTAVGFRAMFTNSVGIWNTAVGEHALYASSGSENTAIGRRAMHGNTTGSRNTAAGTMALYSNISGQLNVALGNGAMRKNTMGARNMGSGYEALYSNTTGVGNTSFGFKSMLVSTTGSYNIAVGHYAGAATTGNLNIVIGNAGNTGENNTIRVGTLGTHSRAFLAGVRGTTTGIANAVPVLIDSSGQLGTTSSSARFKEEIRDMGSLTDRLLELRPVAFRYKPEVQAGERPLEYGLIAEEVAEIFPDLVVYGDDGKPFTVKYHILSSMLLNEMKKQTLKANEQASEIAELREEQSRLRGLEARLAALEARTAEAKLPRDDSSDGR